MVITYDKNNPSMEVGTMYPTMEEFKFAVRQFAIKNEFHLGVEKSDKKIYRAYCKSGDDDRPCPWKINGRKLEGSATVEVNKVFIILPYSFIFVCIRSCPSHECVDFFLLQVTILVDQHECTSSMRQATTTANCKWVAAWAVSILRVEPNIHVVDLKKTLETDHKCTLAYDTVWRWKQRALDEVYGKWSDSFELLFRWKAEVMKRSPESIVEIDVLEVDGEVYFHRFFCALKPCIDGFL